MEPADDQREYEGGLDQWVGQAAVAMEPAAERREHPAIDGDVCEIDPAAIEPAGDRRDDVAPTYVWAVAVS